MSVYIIAQLKFTRRELYDRYQSRFMGVFSEFKGKLLVADAHRPQAVECVGWEGIGSLGRGRGEPDKSDEDGHGHPGDECLHGFTISASSARRTRSANHVAPAASASLPSRRNTSAAPVNRS